MLVFRFPSLCTLRQYIRQRCDYSIQSIYLFIITIYFYYYNTRHRYINTHLSVCLPIYKCHSHRKGIRKEMKRFGAFVVFRVLVWMPADAQMNPFGSNVHAQWFSCWKIRADDHDIII